MNWSNNGERMQVHAFGSITFTDDLTDVKSLSDDGYLTIGHTNDGVTRSVEIRSSGGTIAHSYFVGGSARPWDEEARQWLATELPKLVRRSGLGADSRTRQLFSAKGVDGVLDEIELLGSDYVRRVYFGELFKVAKLDAAAMTRTLTLASTLIHSAYDLAETLIASSPVAARSDTSAKAYVDAAGRLKSDYEHRRVLVTLLQTEGAVGTINDLALESAGSIRSDYDKSETLRAALASGRIRRGDALFAAVRRMTSSHEQQRVLSDLAARPSLSTDLARGLLTAAAGISSAYDRATVLIRFIKAHGVDQATSESFFVAVKTLGSDYEKRRVLIELARTHPERDVLRGTFETVADMRSDYDRAEVLLTFVNTPRSDTTLRQAFVNAAQAIRSSYDQNRVLAALARSESR